MYQRVETDSSFILENGVESIPIVTLADGHGGRAQIAADDGCWVLYLRRPSGKYRHTAWIFPEAHEVMKNLPHPGEWALSVALRAA